MRSPFCLPALVFLKQHVDGHKVNGSGFPNFVDRQSLNFFNILYFCPINLDSILIIGKA